MPQKVVETQKHISITLMYSFTTILFCYYLSVEKISLRKLPFLVYSAKLVEPCAHYYSIRKFHFLTQFTLQIQPLWHNSRCSSPIHFAICFIHIMQCHLLFPMSWLSIPKTKLKIPYSSRNFTFHCKWAITSNIHFNNQKWSCMGNSLHKKNWHSLWRK